VGEEPLDAGFLEAIAFEAGMLIDNAMAFQTIADLRDNLELRVRERTSELDEARAALERTVGQLRRSDRARNEFFTNVSHELRTPLTLILAPLDQLEAQLARAAVPVEDVRLIRRNTQVLLRQIDEILDFARLDADSLQPSPEAFDLAELARDLMAAIRPAGERKHLSLELAADGPLPVHLDPKLVRRVLINLLGNAVKYVDDGARVRLSASREGDQVRLSVEDDGPGIPPEQQARIFERFQRVLDSRGRAIQGTGLGLAMVKEIVELLHGELHLDSAPGQGATFTVWLPREVAGVEGARSPLVPEPLDELLAPLEAEAAGPAEAEEQWAGRDARVLLVEDNEEMRTFLARLLGARFEVLTAASGEEGLARAKEVAPDAVVSDVMMGGLDGYTLCSRLKADPVTRGVPVLLVSARHGADAALEGFRAGAADYVVKPFSAPELLARVEAQIRIRRMGLALVRMEKQNTVGLLSSGIAHEVLNPINAVVNAVEPLRETLREAGVSGGVELLDVVQRAGDRVRRIVRALLAFARHDEVRARPVQLEELIDSVLVILQFRIEGRVRVHRELGWTGELVCVPELFGQVLMNLITNALDALPDGAGTLWIRSARDGDQVRISVKDDGEGVNPGLRERIFDPFFTTKPPGSGTGLGLAVSREVMTMHGGTLELAPPGRGGAELVATLPLAGPPATAAEVVH
jgi:signal transduction histidine kinase